MKGMQILVGSPSTAGVGVDDLLGVWLGGVREDPDPDDGPEGAWENRRFNGDTGDSMLAPCHR